MIQEEVSRDWALKRILYYAPYIDKIIKHKKEDIIDEFLTMRVGELIEKYTEQEWYNLCSAAIDKVKELSAHDSPLQWLEPCRVALSPIIGANYHAREKMGENIYDLYWKTQKSRN